MSWQIRKRPWSILELWSDPHKLGDDPYRPSEGPTAIAVFNPLRFQTTMDGLPPWTKASDFWEPKGTVKGVNPTGGCPAFLVYEGIICKCFASIPRLYGYFQSLNCWNWTTFHNGRNASWRATCGHPGWNGYYEAAVKGKNPGRLSGYSDQVRIYIIHYLGLYVQYID